MEDLNGEAPKPPTTLERNVKRLAKEFGMRIGAIGELCDFSRSTFYNLLDGDCTDSEKQAELTRVLEELRSKHRPLEKKITWALLNSALDLTEPKLDQSTDSDCSERSFDAGCSDDLSAAEKSTLCKAIEVLRKAAHRAKLEKDFTRLRNRLLAITVLQEQMDECDNPISDFKDLVAVESKLMDHIAKARANARLAWVAYRRKDLDLARLASGDAVVTFEKTSPLQNADLRSYLKGLDCFSMVLAHQGNFKEAVRLLEQSLDKRAVLECPLLVAATNHRLGRVYEMAGEFETARIKFELAFRAREALGAVGEAAKTGLHWAKVAFQLKRYDEAQEALAMTEKIGIDPKIKEEATRLRSQIKGAQR